MENGTHMTSDVEKDKTSKYTQSFFVGFVLFVLVTVVSGIKGASGGPWFSRDLVLVLVGIPAALGVFILLKIGAFLQKKGLFMLRFWYALVLLVLSFIMMIWGFNTANF